MFTAAATAVVTVGVSNYIQSDSIDTAVSASSLSGGTAGTAANSLTFGERALQSASGYVAQDVVGKALGQKEHFSWASLVASSVAGGVAGEFGPTQAQVGGGQQFGSAASIGFSSLVEGSVRREVSEALGDHHVSSWESIAENAVGTAAGSYAGMAFPKSYAYDIASEREPQERNAAAQNSSIMQIPNSDLEAAVGRPGAYSLASAAKGGIAATGYRYQVARDDDGNVVSMQGVVSLPGVMVEASTGPSIFDLQSLTVTSRAAVSTLTLRSAASNPSSGDTTLDQGGGRRNRGIKVPVWVPFPHASRQVTDGSAFAANGLMTESPAASSGQDPWSVVVTADASPSLAFNNGVGTPLTSFAQSDGLLAEYFANGVNYTGPDGTSEFIAQDNSILGADRLSDSDHQKVIDRYNTLNDGYDAPGLWHAIKTGVDGLIGVKPRPTLTPDELSERDQLQAIEATHAKYLAEPATYDINLAEIDAARSSVIGSTIIMGTTCPSRHAHGRTRYFVQNLAGSKAECKGDHWRFAIFLH